MSSSAPQLVTVPGFDPDRRRQALVVRGGWDGHQPVEATDLFIPFLEENGFAVDVHDSPKLYADADFMAGVDLIMQCNTMNTIEKDDIWGSAAPSRRARGRRDRTAGSPTRAGTRLTTCT